MVVLRQLFPIAESFKAAIKGLAVSFGVGNCVWFSLLTCLEASEIADCYDHLV